MIDLATALSTVAHRVIFSRLKESTVYGKTKVCYSGNVGVMPVCLSVCACSSVSGCACFVCKYVCISVRALRGNSSLRAGGSSCRRAVFVQPGFVGISYSAHVWGGSGERGTNMWEVDGGGVEGQTGNL